MCLSEEAGGGITHNHIIERLHGFILRRSTLREVYRQRNLRDGGGGPVYKFVISGEFYISCGDRHG